MLGSTMYPMSSRDATVSFDRGSGLPCSCFRQNNIRTHVHALFSINRVAECNIGDRHNNRSLEAASVLFVLGRFAVVEEPVT